MKKKKLGNKYHCFQCGCKFYDLSRPQPLCPKCGTDQSEAKKKAAPPSRPSASIASPPSSRPRKRKSSEEDWVAPDASFDDEDTGDKEPFDADGLSLVQEEDLEGSEDAENTELK